MITWTDFEKVEMRIGTVISADDFPQARKPALKLTIDFGNEIGTKKSSAQITDLYDKESLIGKQIVAVVNFAPKQIANFVSECLVLGVVGCDQGVVLLTPDKQLPDGLRIG